MAKTSIGDFLIKLGLMPDAHSFETGNKLVEGITTGLNKLIGTARNAAVVLTGTAVASGTIESAAYKNATAIGISTEALDLWKASAKIAGVNADGLIGSMGKLANVMNHMTIDGSGLEAYAEQLGKLGISLEDLKDLNPADAYAKIISKAQASLDGTNTTRITTIVGDILGQEGQNFFIELNRQGKSINEFLTGAKATVFTDAASNKKGADFAVEVNTLKTEVQSITKLLGDEIAGELTGYVKQLNDWIQNHGTEIKNTIESITNFVGLIVEKIVGLTTMSKGESINTALNTWLTTHGYINKEGNITHRADFNDLPKALQNDILQYKKEYPFLGFGMFNGVKNIPKMKDGILRPDGTVTQVAPDDWVFAARNVSDLARAFIPQGLAGINAPSQYSIVQNFTINGSTDIPQLLKQQAYAGTQEGLLAVMSQSSQRLQMMSGTR